MSPASCLLVLFWTSFKRTKSSGWELVPTGKQCICTLWVNVGCCTWTLSLSRNKVKSLMHCWLARSPSDELKRIQIWSFCLFMSPPISDSNSLQSGCPSSSWLLLTRSLLTGDENSALDHTTDSRPRCRLIDYDPLDCLQYAQCFHRKYFSAYFFFLLLFLSSGAAGTLCNNYVWQRHVHSTLFPCCSALSSWYRTLVCR